MRAALVDVAQLRLGVDLMPKTTTLLLASDFEGVIARASSDRSMAIGRKNELPRARRCSVPF
jgi:hypothetical protein